MTVPKKNKEKIIKEYQREKNDTGSPEVQVAILTEEIERLASHLKTHRKDFHSRRGLLSMVSKRRRLLNHLSKKNSKIYQELIKRLNLRK